MTGDGGEAPIGVFDSGLGGLSVWREICAQLPDESTLYLADQAHVPYGPRPPAEIARFSHRIAQYLVRHGAKVIVVACNTASGAALYSLREAFPETPFIGMEPAIKPAAERTRSGRVGVIATPTTFQGQLYRRLAHRFGRQVTIYTQVCPGLVEAIEGGRVDHPQTIDLIRRCLAPLLEKGVDQLVLGCTHYPFVRGSIERIAGAAVEVIDPAPAVARQVGRVLARHDLLAVAASKAAHRFCTTGDRRRMSRQAALLLGQPMSVASCVWHDGHLTG